MGSLFAFLPEVFIFATLCTVLLRGVFRGQSFDREKAMPKVLAYSIRLGIGGLFASFFWYMLHSARFHGSYFSGFMVVDTPALVGKMLVLGFGCFWLGFRFRFCREPMDRLGFNFFEYPVLLMLSLLGSCLMLSSNSLLTVYLSLEMQMLPVCVLLALSKKNPKSIEASFKYFLLSTVASIFILYGMGLVYGSVGSTEFRVLSYLTQEDAHLWLQGGVLFILAGLFFKLALFPFHAWVPDVYEGSANMQTAFIATVPKITAFFFLMRLWFVSFGHVISLDGLFSWMGVASILFGSVMAMSQDNIRRLLAYGSIAQMGFVILGFSLKSFNALSGSLMYLILYALGVNALFLGLTTLKKGEEDVHTLHDLKGLWSKNPLVALSFGVIFLSFAGIPPFAGFWAKFYVLLGLVKAGFYTQAALAMVGSLLGFYYYLRILKVMFFDQDTEGTLTSSKHWHGTLMGVGLFLSLFFLVQERLMHFIGQVF